MNLSGGDEDVDGDEGEEKSSEGVGVPMEIKRIPILVLFRGNIFDNIFHLFLPFDVFLSFEVEVFIYGMEKKGFGVSTLLI